MPKTLTLVLASAALTAAIGLPAWSAMHAPQGEALARLGALAASAGDAARLILVDDDGDEAEGHASPQRSGADDDGECEDDDVACGPALAAPAPGGSVKPPQNGLFNDGAAAPQVQVK